MGSFSDDFNRPDGNNVDSGWTTPGAVYPNFDILTQALRSRGGIGDIVLTWNAVFRDDQFSQALVSTLTQLAGNGAIPGLCVRSIPTGGLGTCYLFRRRPDLIPIIWELVKFPSTPPGGFTQLATLADVIIPGDTLRLSIIGSRLTVLQNGATVISVLDQAPGTVPSGAMGFFNRTGSPTDIWFWDNWTGGDIAGTHGRLLWLRH